MERRLSYVHVGGSTPLIGGTIDTFLKRVIRRFPGREAVVSIPQDVRLSYEDLDHGVERVARGLLALNVEKGDRVAIWSTDTVEWILLQLATARIGAVLVSINPAYRIDELKHALELARVQVMVMIPSFRSSDYVGMTCGLCPEVRASSPGGLHSASLPGLRHLVVYDPDDPHDTARPAPGFLTWPEMIEGGEAVAFERIDERASSLDSDDPINIQFTSGTTGFPKAVVLSHHNILNNAFFVAEAMRFTEEDRLCVPVPFYHCFGMVVSNLACLTHGAAIVIPAAHFEAGATLAAIQKERCTALHGVPTMFAAELDLSDFHDYDLSSLRTGIMGGAPCPPRMMERVMHEMGCREILIAYGQTESSPVTHLTHPEDPPDKRTQTVGTNLPHQEVKIADPDTGATMPIGEQGEVCLRGYHVMRGYFGHEQATREVIDSAGWLHSGDLGRLDLDGYLQITGRLKDMIIRGGENIYPAEIEAFYYGHPDVSEIAVVGIPDPKMGEEVGAWIKLRDGVTADPEQFRAYAKGRIAHSKVPRYIWIVNEFPMTVTGKIQKFRVSEISSEWLAGAEHQEKEGGSLASCGTGPGMP